MAGDRDVRRAGSLSPAGPAVRTAAALPCHPFEASLSIVLGVLRRPEFSEHFAGKSATLLAALLKHAPQEVCFFFA